jgi:DNA-directed RNA polymerase subunit RPC12/RpoP
VKSPETLNHIPTYDVKCPQCGKQAVATMRDGGIAGTYREPLVELVAQRIVCTHCGFNVMSKDAIPYELWYKVSIRGQTAWACNKIQATLLVDYLLNRLSPREIDSVYVETLPEWMINSKNRELVAQKFQCMLDKNT